MELHFSATLSELCIQFVSEALATEKEISLLDSQNDQQGNFQCTYFIFLFISRFFNNKFMSSRRRAVHQRKVRLSLAMCSGLLFCAQMGLQSID